MSSKERVRDLVKKRRESGLCVKCKQPSEKYYCKECQKKVNEKVNNYYKNNPVKRKEQSRKKYIKNKEKWKLKNLCPKCGKKTLNKTRLCENHYLKQIALKQLGSGKYSNQLKQLLIDQDYKCALTGRKISLEDETEIDHIIPTSRGGTKTMNNVRWVIKNANRLKGYFLDEEMMPIIKDILNSKIELFN